MESCSLFFFAPLFFSFSIIYEIFLLTWSLFLSTHVLVLGCVCSPSLFILLLVDIWIIFNFKLLKKSSHAISYTNMWIYFNLSISLLVLCSIFFVYIPPIASSIIHCLAQYSYSSNIIEWRQCGWKSAWEHLPLGIMN